MPHQAIMDFDLLTKQHPCFNVRAHFKYARIHLPVSPECNIHCRFCVRGFNKEEERPGICRRLLSVDEAVETVSKAMAIYPELTVAGIAGPGDPLATDHALEVFGVLQTRFPKLIKCLSTNGLLLAEKAERMIAVGVRAVTVTVNAIDVSILEQICAYVIYSGQRVAGARAADLLISAQLAGIHEISALGAVVRINTVLIPGINSHHIEQIAQVTSKLGASLINIIPLIPQGTFKNMRAPSDMELQMARQAARRHLPVFRFCRRCRADACGVPGLGDHRTTQLHDEPTYPFSHC